MADRPETSRKPVASRAGGAASPDSRSLAQAAYDHIKKLILSGVFKDGEKIPEERIALILNMSRTPIREALRQLGQYGLVEIKPRSYAKVAGVTPREAGQIGHIRIELEKMAARSLIRNFHKKDLTVLGRIARSAVAKVRAGNVADAFELDSAFHLEMVKRSDNVILYDILERLDAKTQLNRIRTSNARSLDATERFFHDHTDMVELLAAGDEPGLLRVIERHLGPE